jgi:prolyl oligopeptidase
MSGFNSPSTIARYDFAAPEDQRWSILRRGRVSGLDPDDFESQQMWCESEDSTKVPMFIVRHKSTKLDGTAPVLQYGYGGFGISTTPYFNPTVLAFLQAYGAILAVVNIRGGGEFGREWHRAGIRENKSKACDDLIAAAKYLVANKYTARGKIAIHGISNGGLIVCATVTRAPEGLFGAVIAEYGVQDLLKFCNFTHGAAWKSEYGDPSVPMDFDFMYPLSPVHNVPVGRVLPATMLMVSPDDEQVVPMHSYKLIAGLQHAAPDNPNPLILHVSERGGHGAGKPTDQRLRESIDKFGFVAQSLGLVWRDKN